jgi:dihydrodipicolinate synthase/N-acetylneuraminate lyase
LKMKGIITAPLTPMSQDGSELANVEIFSRYYRFLIERDINALLISGTTGEAPLLTLAERKTLAERALGIVSHAIPVIIHVGCISTAETIELAQHAASVGADGIAVITPFYFHYNPASIEKHFRAVAEAVPDLPVYLYYFPEFTQNDISPELLQKLLISYPNIVGIKHSDSDMLHLQEYRKVAGCDFSIFSGDDSMEFASLSLGANGCVSGKSSAFPELPVALFRAFSSGNISEARRIQLLIDDLAGVIDGPPGMGIAYFKASLKYRGIDIGSVRLPLLALSGSEYDALVNGLDELRLNGTLSLLVD